MEQLLNSSAEPTPLPSDAPQRALESDVVTTDLDCRRCGYNLRSLAWSGVCPECATPIASSRIPEDLKLSSWRRIRRIRLGLSLLVVTLASCVVLMVAYRLIALYSLQLAAAGPPLLYRFIARSANIISSHAGIFEIVSFWLILDPLGARRLPRTDRLAIIATLLIFVGSISLLLGSYMWSHVLTIPQVGGPLEAALWTLPWVLVIVRAPAYLLLCIWLRLRFAPPHGSFVRWLANSSICFAFMLCACRLISDLDVAVFFLCFNPSNFGSAWSVTISTIEDTWHGLVDPWRGWWDGKLLDAAWLGILPAFWIYLRKVKTPQRSST